MTQILLEYICQIGFFWQSISFRRWYRTWYDCSECNDCLLVKVILRDKFVDGKATKRNTVVSKSLLACFSLQGF